MTGSTEQDVTTDYREALRSLSLESILLWELAVKRGDAEEASVGHVDGSVNISSTVEEDNSAVHYLVEGHYEFENQDSQQMALVDVSFMASYVTSDDDVELTPELVERFARSVVMQVTPFQREVLATITNRLGIPPFYLPLMRLNEIQMQRAETGE